LSTWTIGLILATLVLFIFPASLNAQVNSLLLYKVVNAGQSIQEAINNATDVDTILISSGIYVEKSYPIIVNKSLIIIGENLRDTIIDGNKNLEKLVRIEILRTEGFKGTLEKDLWSFLI